MTLSNTMEKYGIDRNGMVANFPFHLGQLAGKQTRFKALAQMLFLVFKSPLPDHFLTKEPYLDQIITVQDGVALPQGRVSFWGITENYNPLLAEIQSLEYSPRRSPLVV